MSIVAENVTYTYAIGTPAEGTALRDVSMTADRGEWVSVVGHTGSGKSTLAQHLNVLLIAQCGTVTIDGVVVREKSKDLRSIRRKVGLVFQYPEQQFFSETVREEIAFAPSNWGVVGAELDVCVNTAAQAVGLDVSLLSSNPFALSGGQRRRVALASVMAMCPDYLILDEPTAGLDATGIRELFQLLNEAKRGGMGIVQVTHDLASALSFSDRILVLEEGQSVSYGDPESIAAYLLERPVRGLVLPPLVAFCAALRARGVPLPLTSDIQEILGVLKKRRGDDRCDL
ncbi:ATP-binding cassette domain-containing protein [Synergistaceae bacterium OttesenSCG-928-I11]|nr:ATP-binding cassette domain-containing protein [Synergistaceae bacterium OttesenSCG-928-I11]